MSKRKSTRDPWMLKTDDLYSRMVRSEREYMRVKVDLPFTRAEFREWLKATQRTPSAVMWLCYLCHRPMTFHSVSIDHVTPLAHAGRTTLDNLKVCCTSCNRAKGAMSLTGYRSIRDAVNSLHPKEQRYFWTRWSAGSKARWTEAKRADDRKAREILKRVSISKKRT